MFDFFKKDTLPRGARKSIAPDAEFIKKAKGRFLASFDVHYAATKPLHRLTFMTKFAVVAMILVGATAGVTVYADTNNVPVESPLYPLKRLGENVQLTLASPAKKSQLEATFASRRAAEIDDLEKTHPSSTLIAGLSSDLDKEVNTSIDNATNGGAAGVTCGKVLSVLASSSSAIQQELSSHPRVLARFEDQCGSTLATSTINVEVSTASTTVSTTLAIPGILSHPARPHVPLLHGLLR